MSFMHDPTAAVDMTAAAVSRIALGVEYNGTAYYGFQLQNNDLPTLQGELERALTTVAGGEPVRLVCAGRTDAGVHACEQVLHFDTPVVRKPAAWLFGSNRYLPRDISVVWVKQVPEQFHARFSAKRRRYRYVIHSDPVRPALLRDGVTWTHKQLDVCKMNQAARFLLGTHDFSSFRDSDCQAKSPVKTLDGIRLTQYGRFIVLDIRASAFLHHMVRNIAGTLMRIGAGDKPVEWMRQVLQARRREVAGVTAPPYGLYLVQVEYPEEFELPRQPLGPLFLSAMPDVFAEDA
ncbi:tRNA pseudouridine(38-40) synthase TruA [Thiopseudomonas denitrificans]|uniref:tRNA pseudouridine synthase A n=1 Tax=Thiopseudomonas denitrificans TaxID=1501432 RepID=A0A4R6U191_9GAMM|nr:tRNA pseudouridine38-40 synthase [Thiopseudomonas denitrificans]